MLLIGTDDYHANPVSIIEMEYHIIASTPKHKNCFD